MEMVVKLSAIAILCTISSLVLRQYKSEYSYFIELAGIILIVVFAVDFAKSAISELKSILDFSDIGAQTIEILVKALGIAALTGISSDICKDNSNQALAGTLEFFGKAAVVALCIPLIKAVAALALGLINS